MERLKNFFFKNTSNKQTVVKNTLWLFLGEGVSRLLKIFLIIYAARTLGSGGWGTVAYTLSLGSLLMILSDLGIGGIITRESIQKKEHSAFLTTALFLKFLITLLSVIAIVLIGPVVTTVANTAMLFPLVAITLFFDAIRDTLLNINTAYEKMERDALVRLLFGGITLIVGILLLRQHPSPSSVLYAYSIGSAVGALIALILVRRELRTIPFTFEITLLKRIGIITLPFITLSIVNTILANGDTYLLGIWSNSESIGFYNASQRIYQLLLMLPAIIGNVFFPLQSRFATTSMNQFSTVLQKATRFLFLGGLPLGLIGILCAKPLITLFYGVTFAPAAPLLVFFLLTFIAASPLVLFSNALIALDKQYMMVRAYVIGVIINITANLLLIPFIGAIGAAISLLISTTSISLFLAYQVHCLAPFIKIRSWLRPCISLLAMILFVYFLRGFFSFLPLFVTALCLYGCILLLLREPFLVELFSLARKSYFTND